MSFFVLRWLKHILQGLGIGVANVIPGVSGGTMALVLGIYESVIEIAASAVRAGLALFRLDIKSFREQIAVLPYGFLIPLVVGIVLAPVLGASFIPDAMEAWPTESRALFFGLILGSIAIPWLRIRKAEAREYALTLLAAALAFVLSGLPPTEIPDPTLVQIFLAAAVAVCAMVLPGVSGAFLLLVFGLYAPVLEAIAEPDVLIVGVFLAGSLSGFGAFSVFMRWLLRDYHDQTMAVLVGLMVGSLRALWPWLGSNRGLEWYPGDGTITGVMTLFAVGFLLSAAVTVYEMKKNREGADSTSPE